MPLDFQRLENLRSCPGGHRAACPACRDDDGDRKGDHLFIGEDGRFGCAVHQGDRDHRRRIFALAGVRDGANGAPSLGGSRRRSRRIGKKGKRYLGRRKALAAEAGRRLDAIVNRNRSDDWRADLWHESPIRLDGEPCDDWILLLGCLFPREAIVFIGDLHDSGEGRGEGHFRRVEEWLQGSSLPGPRIAAATFRSGTIHRRKDCVESRPYLVLESDDLIGHKPTTATEREQNKAATAALFQWFVHSLGMHLAAVIDTGNRSLHGWFRMPRRPGLLSQLEFIAPKLHLDPSLFRQPNAPLRLPGTIHEKTGEPARLLYLDDMT